MKKKAAAPDCAAAFLRVRQRFPKTVL